MSYYLDPKVKVIGKKRQFAIVCHRLQSSDSYEDNTFGVLKQTQ